MCTSVVIDKFPRPINKFIQPGHHITVVAPVYLVNLLPVDLKYYINGQKNHKILKGGETDELHYVSFLFSFIEIIFFICMTNIDSA